MENSGTDYDAVLAQLRRDFLDTADDYLDRLEKLVGRAPRLSSVDSAGVSEIRRLVHSLKGMGGSFGYPVMSVIAHRFEDYLDDVTSLTDKQANDSQTFVDRMRDVVEGIFASDDPNTAQIVRNLPIRDDVNLDNAIAINTDIMLISPRGTAAHIVQSELRSQGYNVAIVASPVEAIELAVRTRPDLVIASVVLSVLSGIDLANAFAAMSPTRLIPFALLTAWSLDDERFRTLPPRVQIIHKGTAFRESLAEALTKLDIS